MGGSCSLPSLGSLAGNDVPTEKLVEWVSKHGLLGFRNEGSEAAQPLGLMDWIIPGDDRFHGPELQVGFAYEPLELIREAAKVAAATSALWAALQKGDRNTRKVEIENLIKMDRNTTIDNQEEMSVLGVPIRGFLRKPADTSVQWTALGFEALSGLTDQYLGDEFRLYWSGPRGLNRNITSGWKVRSLLGALFLKMASHARKTRYCAVCSDLLGSHARSDARTCSSRCRKRLERYPEKYV